MRALLHDVGVRHDAIPGDDEARADAFADGAGIPRVL